MQAPPSMKSVLQAFRLMTQAGGNLIVVIITMAKIVDSQVYEFLLFAGLMFVDMIIFGWLISKYKYVDRSKDFENNDAEEKGETADKK